MNIPGLKIPKLNFRDPRIRNAAIVIACGIGGLVAWHQMIYVKRQETMAQLKDEEGKKQAELNSILAMKPQLEKLKADILAANKQLDSLKSIFPDQKEIPKLIGEITRIAVGSGIQTKKFSPLPDVQKEYFVENRYSLAIAGGYHEVADFFASLANLALLVNLSEVALNPGPGATPAADEAATGCGDEPPPTVSVSFKMTTFSSRR